MSYEIDLLGLKLYWKNINGSEVIEVITDVLLFLSILSSKIVGKVSNVHSLIHEIRLFIIQFICELCCFISFNQFSALSTLWVGFCFLFSMPLNTSYIQPLILIQFTCCLCNILYYFQHRESVHHNIVTIRSKIFKLDWIGVKLKNILYISLCQV